LEFSVSLAIHQIIKTGRRTISLTVETDGSLVVRAPLKVSESMIHTFVESKKRWVDKKRLEAASAKPPRPKQFINGEIFHYLGNEYPLEIVSNQPKALQLEGHFKLSDSWLLRADQAFEHWYRAQARKFLAERVRFFAEKYELQFDSIRLSSARTRWGSCSARGVLSFTWRLIMTPIDVIDYVVVHELVHTLVHNHSRRYWGKVEKILPQYLEPYEWLRKNGHQVDWPEPETPLRV
jgi:predicted metal-dependent hydrolase